MSEKKPTASASRGKAFKPRAGIVRKSKEERDAHAKQEAEKAAVRAAAAVQAAGKASATTRPSVAKKRDGTRDNRDDSRRVTSGVFGAGTGGSSREWKKSTYAGQSELLEGQESVKPSDGPRLVGQDTENDGQKQKGGLGGYSEGSKTARGPQVGAVFESDDEPDETRRDIERIWISDDEEEVTEGSVTGKGKARAISEGRRARQSGGLRPVRAPRALAEDNEADAESRGDKKTVKSSRTVVDDGEGHDEGDDLDVDDEAIADQLQMKQDVPSSPEISRRGKPGRKLGARMKDSKIAVETVEEKAERLRLREDIEKLRVEFMPLAKAEQNADISDEESTKPDTKLFLFQFPPLVPFLADQTQTSLTSSDGKQQTQEPGPAIKSDPDGPAPASTATNEDLPAETTVSKPRLEGMLTANEPLRLPAGLVGKLRVHKSGKVSLDWGGTDMEVRYGTEVDFLQDAVLVETPRQSSEGEEKASSSQIGTTYALGQVQKKMVVIPDWQKLYD